ncbi:MAG: TetR/AcrR family transcriptional regulator [Bacteroidales bacterium]|nr:TetR/AcrR family transcriptional regulator [Bacteroidales bacterium]
MEQKIIEAAKATFLKKGFKDTNMSDIAAEVGLTRPAMHYYFRTKERLFQAVFGDILMSFLPKVSDTITSDLPLEEKIGAIADAYLAILKENPQLPMFLMKEAMRDLDGFVQMALGINISQAGNNVFNAIESEIASGKIRNVPVIEIFYTFYGLIAMPFLTMPIASHIFGQAQIDELLNERWRTHVVRHMMFLLKP